MGLIIKIALGLILGYVIILAANIALASYAFDQVTKSTNKMLQQQQQKRLNKKLRKEELERLEIQKKQQGKLLALTKDKAWFKWYKEPKDCSSWKSDNHMVECTNHKMRAKKQFNKIWAQQ